MRVLCMGMNTTASNMTNLRYRNHEWVKTFWEYETYAHNLSEETTSEHSICIYDRQTQNTNMICGQLTTEDHIYHI